MEYEKLSNEDIENIKIVADKVAEKIKTSTDSSKRELRSLSLNPLDYLVQNGLKKSIATLISKNKDLYRRFQFSIRDFSRSVWSGVKEHLLTECTACIIGLIMLLTAILAANGLSFYSLSDMQDFLVSIISKYYFAEKALDTVFKTCFQRLKKAGIPHLSANNLAEYICYQAGICPAKGIL
jgi:hypothetical protein